MKTFGDKLKDARTAKGLKQSEVAEKLDCAPTSLTNWENGKVQPSLDVLSRICEVYEISPLSLLTREYSYNDIVTISEKPVPEREYEEQIALNFSHGILSKLIAVEAQRQETARIEATATFLRQTDLLNRFGGSMNKEQIEAVKAEYESNGNADGDILFAYHALTVENKRALLSMLSGLLMQSDNVQWFNDKMDAATAFTLAALDKERNALK
ncbi:helix-turn-helix domain-containing protein [Cloacibacillus evryensis]|uniref:helix-turn-helix domain-containing protein n=1 Tax=Cloacibacillus evryensis TaxID=508460 RepID=UPI000240DCBB|nr:helix-turn-helix transcriptional regulator [Cloacibacillus evryensis]EHL69845.1 hypothetical protein HMPREF1006_01801 [Synergistes sp. 3_1_syn1]